MTVALLSVLPAPASYGKPTLRPSVAPGGVPGVSGATGQALHPVGFGHDWGGSAARTTFGIGLPHAKAQLGDTSYVADRPASSADGQLVAFTTDALNFSINPPDTNGFLDVYVHDVLTNSSTLVSQAVDGSLANGPSGQPSMSETGRFIAFASDADNLVASDKNGRTDVFVRDLATGTTTLVSRRASGTQGDGDSGAPSISADGRLVAFQTFATNFSSDSNGTSDVFVYDRDDDADGVFDETDGTSMRLISNVCVECAETANGASFAPAIAAKGDFVAFESDATDLVTLPSERIGSRNIYYADELGSSIELVSDSTAAGDARAPAISADGSVVAFETTADLLSYDDVDGTSDIYTWHSYGSLEFLYTGSEPSFAPSWSYDGETLAFATSSGNLISTPENPDNYIDTNDVMDVYEYSWYYGGYDLKSVSGSGALGDGNSYLPVMGGYGGSVAFLSDATNLVFDDLGNTTDAFEVRYEDCAGERAENGLLSQPIYENVLPNAGNWEPLLHRTNCEFIAGNGL